VIGLLMKRFLTWDALGLFNHGDIACKPFLDSLAIHLVTSQYRIHIYARAAQHKWHRNSGAAYWNFRRKRYVEKPGRMQALSFTIQALNFRFNN
jgi:hypothetical protein